MGRQAERKELPKRKERPEVMDNVADGGIESVVSVASWRKQKGGRWRWMWRIRGGVGGVGRGKELRPREVNRHQH